MLASIFDQRGDVVAVMAISGPAERSWKAKIEAMGQP